MKNFKKLTMYDENIISTTSNDCGRPNDVTNWISVEDYLPDELETVWISNGKGFTTLGCLVYIEGAWYWAEHNGTIYQDKDKIVAECDLEDLDVQFWHRLPKAIIKQ